MRTPAFLGDVEITRKKLFIGLAVIVGFVGLTLLYRLIDVKAIHQWAEGVNGVIVFSLVTILPMLGFPVSVAHAVAGVRFGLGMGLGLVAISIVLQMLASYALVKAMPNLFAKRFDSLRKKLPKGAHRSVTLFTMLFPGAPYFAQNYVLPVVGVPLSTYMIWGVPIHIVKSTVGILFGDMSDNLTPMKVAGFVGYTVVTTVVCAWAFRRLRAQMKDPQSAASGRKRRA